MFELKGIFKEKLHVDGFPIRTPSPFQIHLNSEMGVVRFINEHKPFSDITIKEIGDEEKKDRTEYFLAKAKEEEEHNI